MPAFAVKNIPADLYEKFKRSARRNRRSINSEILVCMEDSLNHEPGDTKRVLQRARELREIPRDEPVYNVDMNEAKRLGRD